MGPTDALTAGVVASALAAAGVLVGGSWRRPGRGADGGGFPRTSGASLVTIGASLAVLGLGSLATFAVAGRHVEQPFFALAHTIYLAAVVGTPIVGALVLAGAAIGRSSRRPVVLAVGLAMALLAPIGFYGTHIAPYRLRVETVAVPVPAERAGHDTIRIAVLADLQNDHVGGYEERVVDRLLAQDPDLILVPGDLFQGDEGQWAANHAAMRTLLGRLHAPGGVFAVRGDSDGGRRLDVLTEGTGIRILDDEVVHLTVGDRKLAIQGNQVVWNAASAEASRAELMTAPADEIRIAVSHRPDAAFGFPHDGDVDLVVAGHTHGGQIALPLLGPVSTLSDVPRRVGAGGLHEIDGNPIYVSVGIGLERLQAPQVRLGTRPTIGIVELGRGHAGP